MNNFQKLILLLLPYAYAYFPLTGLIDLYQPNKPQSGGFSTIFLSFLFYSQLTAFHFLFFLVNIIFSVRVAKENSLMTLFYSKKVTVFP
jgi:hypothetical protein